MARKKPVSRLLRDGADVMAQRGNARRVLEDGDGRVCLMGALNIAAHGESRWRPTTEQRVRDAGDLAVAGKGGLAPWVWNNERASGTVEVVEVMREAALHARGAELARERERAMRHPFARRPRDVESSITPEMRRAWADAADKLERTNRDEAIRDTSRNIPEFDWGGIIREETELRDAVEAKYAANPLGVSTGP